MMAMHQPSMRFSETKSMPQSLQVQKSVLGSCNFISHTTKIHSATHRSLNRRQCTNKFIKPMAIAAPSSAASPTSTQTVNWNEYWWPIAYSHDVEKIYPFTLLEEPIVIWRDGSGKLRCFLDRCPHRLVPLSEGRIAANGTLECPYHGWQFNSSGTCTSIPQGGNLANPRTCATAYQCLEKQGTVWVKLQPVPAGVTEAELGADIPILEELDDPDFTETVPFFRDIPMDYSTLIENVVDAAHVPFTHDTSVSKRATSSDFSDMRVTEEGRWGFTGLWLTGPRRGALGAQSTLFQGPNLMRHTIDSLDKRGFKNVTAVYGAPIRPGRCRLIVRQPFKFKNKLIKKLFTIFPRFIGHLGNLSVIDDDNIFLHMQEREQVLAGLAEKPIGQVYHMPGPSDAYVIAFRSWLAKYAGGGPFGPQDKAWLEKAGPRLDTDQLLDHYHSHVSRCTVCQTALKRIKLAKSVSRALTVLGVTLATTAATMQWVLSNNGVATAPLTVLNVPVIPLAGIVAVIGGLVWRWCNKTLPKFFKGVPTPPRNLSKDEFVPFETTTAETKQE